MTGALPRSEALTEADPDSLSYLMSKDPEHYSKLDIGRLVEALRAQRIKWQAAEASKASAPRTKAAPKATTSAIAAGDLDL